MTKADLIAKVANLGVTKKMAGKVVDTIFDSITKALKRGDKVQLIGFGGFEVRRRAARTGRNPRTGESLRIPARRIPAFRPGKQLREAVK
jgi:DNA-binding protein HU-beta